MNYRCECGVRNPMSYTVSDVKAWGRNVKHSLIDYP